MADPKDYILVRLDDNIQDNALLAYDVAKDMLVDSGLHGYQGELNAEASTVNVGMHGVSSAGEQVVFYNNDSKVAYAPPWHVIDEISPGGSLDRQYIGTMASTRPSRDPDIVLENPVVTLPGLYHTINYRLTMQFPEAHKDVQFKVEHAGQEMWSMIKDVSAGENEFRLDVPMSFAPGSYTFSIQPYGDPNLQPPVKVMGNSDTGAPWFFTHYRLYRDIPLATQEYVDTAVTTGGTGNLQDIMFKDDYDTDRNGTVDLAENVKGATTAGNDKYYGTDDSGSVGFHTLPTVDGGHPEISKLQAQVTQNTNDVSTNKQDIATNKAEIDKHETSINAHGVQLAKNTSDIATNTANIKIAIDHSKSAVDEGLQNRKNAVNSIVAEVDHTHKTFTLKLMSQTGLVDSALIDLSTWFSGGTQPQPGTDYKIYYGFTAKTTLPEDEILRIGTTKSVSTVNSLDVPMTRTQTTPSYMWIWLPDSAGPIKGFDFSGFVSVWNDTAINVAGVDGKLYVSPNQTAARSIEFEVKV